MAILSVGLDATQLSAPPSPDVNALIRSGQYDQAESVARAHVERTRAHTGGDVLQVATAADLLIRAMILNGRATNSEALELATHAVQAKETILGTEHPDLVPSLINLGDALTAAGEFDRAISTTERAVRLSEHGAGGSKPTLELARALDHLGSAFSARRRHDDALKAFTRSLSLKEQLLDPLDVEIARTLEGMALVLQRTAAYTQSGALVRRAASIQEAVDAGHPAYATTLNLLAQQLWFEGDLLASKDASERAVAHSELTLRPVHPTIALSIRYLAGTVCDLGDAARCLALNRRALEIAESAFGPNHFATGEYLNDLGFTEFDQGNYQDARRLLQQSLTIYEARYGSWHEYVAGSLNGLARADTRLGNYATATRELSRVAAIHARIGGANHPYVAMALSDLASVYLERGLQKQALPLLERALAIREKALGPEHRDVARTLADLAATLVQMGQLARAQQLTTRALRIWERLDAPEAPAYATILALYAKLQLDRGDSAAARDYYEQALAIRAKVFGRSHPLYAEAQAGLALALAATGDRAAALTTASSAETTGREHLSLMLRSLPEREALNYAVARPRGLDLVLSLAGSTPESTPLALDELIRSRALVLDEIAVRQSWQHERMEDVDRHAGLISAQQRLANLIVRGPGQMSPTQYQGVVDAARQESERAEQALAEASAEFRAARRRAQIGVEQVVAALPADGALVSFARYQRTVFDNGSFSKRTIPSYIAVVARPNRAPVSIPLGSAQNIDSLVSQWRADISAEVLAAGQEPPHEVVRSSRESGAVLRRRVWDPVAAHVNDAARVFIVPEGALSLVPFVAFPIGSRSYLLENGPLIHYLSAERDLVPFINTPASGRGLLALGGPSFDESSLFRRGSKSATSSNTASAPAVRGATAATCEGLDAASFQPLEGTLQEVRDISSVWKTNPTTESEAARVLVGRNANETRFKREAPGSRVLHVATHGFFLDGSCSAAPSGTRAIGGLSTTKGSRLADNPLRLSGLALAGANQRALAAQDEDEGILTAEEVAALNLAGVEWAVLSACDTGIGEIKTGEGVFGLRRAFQVAGARTVIMSLWSVDDEATREWMRALYQGRFQKALSTADAVHAANLAVLRARRARGLSTHPFYWAGFVAAGDWR